MTLDEWLQQPADCPQGRSADFVAEVRFLPAADGGRAAAVRSGYRADHDLGLPNTLSGARHDYANGHADVDPGNTVFARLTLLAPELQIKRLHEGMTFSVREGPHIVALGKIIRVFNESLQR